MQSPHTYMVALALCCTSMHSLTQAAVQPFLAPPTLTEKSQAGPPKGGNELMQNAQADAAAPCNPSGDISREGHDIKLTLPVEMRTNKIRNPAGPKGTMDTVSLRSYGGCLSGPLIEARPGDTLRINLINNLSQNDPSCPNGLDPTDGSPGCFNTINLHMHGMHVSPSGNSDNVLLNIAPQTRLEYEINIPSDHPAGTFWYHAHRHGSTAMQVASGASGALVVRGKRRYVGNAPGDIDTILHDARGKAFAERVFLLQQIPYACFNNGKIIKLKNGNWDCPPGMTGVVEDFANQLSSPTVWDDSGRFTSINGAVQPTLQNIGAGEIQRWRFIHAGIHDTVNLQIVPMNTNSPNANLLLKGMLGGTPREQAAAIAEACPVLVAAASKPVDLVPQFEIASDGLTRIAMRPIGVKQKSISGGIGSNYLQPGYRSDVLVVFPKAGTYCMLNQAATSAERANGGQGPNIGQLLATVIVSGGTPITTDPQSYIQQALYEGNRGDQTLPAAALNGLLKGDLSPWRGMSDLPDTGINKDKQSAAFFIGTPSASKAGPAPKFGFYINEKSYDPDRIDFTRQVGSIDDWVLTSKGEPHIFHIHVNPFQIIDVLYAPNGAKGTSIYGPNGECKVPPNSTGLENQYCGMWRTFKDTVFVQNDYQVLVRTRYDRYIGEFVIHCHILDHEDGGMMANIKIVPDASAPGGGIGMSGMKHMDHSGAHKR